MVSLRFVGNTRFASLRRCVLAASLLAALAFSACDPTEDPRLLNPPLPDSTLIRVVNLTEGDPAYVSINGISIAANVAGLEASPYKPVLFTERVSILVTRGSRTDTLHDQALSPGVRATVFVMMRGTE